jgi:phospholipase/lecithinase/hemolysin
MRYLIAPILMLLSQLSPANPLTNMVIFGDSLSDNGNLFEYMHHQLPQPPYFDGRFSDGPIWAEDLAQSYFNTEAASHLKDYAFGGAGVLNDINDDEELFTLKREISTYLLAHNDQADPNSMFFVWIGGNNYLGVPEDIQETVNEVIEGIQTDLERLVKKGAKHLTIINIPDLSKTPLAKVLEAEAQFTTYSETHNKALLAMVEKLRESHPEVQWLFFDANQIFSEIYTHPADYGFNQIQDTCYDALVQPNSPKTVLNMVSSVHSKLNHPQNCDGYFFFDLIHPTKQVHQLTAEHLKHLFDQENVSFGSNVATK